MQIAIHRNQNPALVAHSTVPWVIAHAYTFLCSFSWLYVIETLWLIIIENIFLCSKVWSHLRTHVDFDPSPSLIGCRFAVEAFISSLVGLGFFWGFMPGMRWRWCHWGRASSLLYCFLVWYVVILVLLLNWLWYLVKTSLLVFLLWQ